MIDRMVGWGMEDNMGLTQEPQAWTWIQFPHPDYRDKRKYHSTEFTLLRYRPEVPRYNTACGYLWVYIRPTHVHTHLHVPSNNPPTTLQLSQPLCVCCYWMSYTVRILSVLVPNPGLSFPPRTGPPINPWVYSAIGRLEIVGFLTPKLWILPSVKAALNFKNQEREQNYADEIFQVSSTRTNLGIYYKGYTKYVNTCNHLVMKYRVGCCRKQILSIVTPALLWYASTACNIHTECAKLPDDNNCLVMIYILK